MYTSKQQSETSKCSAFIAYLLSLWRHLTETSFSLFTLAAIPSLHNLCWEERGKTQTKTKNQIQSTQTSQFLRGEAACTLRGAAGSWALWSRQHSRACSTQRSGDKAHPTFCLSAGSQLCTDWSCSKKTRGEPHLALRSALVMGTAAPRRRCSRGRGAAQQPAEPPSSRRSRGGSEGPTAPLAQGRAERGGREVVQSSTPRAASGGRKTPAVPGAAVQVHGAFPLAQRKGFLRPALGRRFAFLHGFALAISPLLFCHLFFLLFVISLGFLPSFSLLSAGFWVFCWLVWGFFLFIFLFFICPFVVWAGYFCSLVAHFPQ